jgi:NADH dehydrogenase
MTAPFARHRVVIIGGGFAGLFAARRLKRSDVSVTLIDRSQHHVFQPLLYQCATGIMSEGKIATPLRDLLRKYRNVDCVMAEVIDVDVAARRVIALRPGGAGSSSATTTSSSPAASASLTSGTTSSPAGRRA